MAEVFADLRDHARRERGLAGVGALWMKEACDVLRTAARARLGRNASSRAAAGGGTPARGPDFVSEVRWAWRGVRARGWRFVLMVSLAALTLAANATMFAVTDALVFDAFPFPDADRIVTLRETLADRVYLTREQAARRLGEWARQSDIFTATGGYQQKTLFLTGTGITERVPTVEITVGFLDVLGVRPEWGRGFVAGDELGAPEFAVLLSEDLARRVYGSPAAAVGQVLETTAAPHRVVGVMPRTFAYPSASQQIWRAYDPTGPLARNVGAVGAMGRLAPGLTLERAEQRLAERAPVVGASLGVTPYEVSLEPVVRRRPPAAQRTMLMVLLGAALSLALVAFANVASLELASAINRSRIHAVQLALGAPRASLARVAALEGAFMVVCALAVGIALALLARGLIVAGLPESMRFSTQNRVDVGLRAIGYTAAVACAAWLLAAMPPIVAATRTSLLSLLKLEDRASAVSRASVHVRRALTVAQIGAAVALIITGLLYASSYQALLSIEKGFDSYGLAEVSTSYPADFFASRQEDRFQMAERMKAALTAPAGIEAATHSSAPPSLGDSPSRLALEIDDRPPLPDGVLIGTKWVDESYFDVVRLPVRAGRVFMNDEQPDSVVVPESFARKFWPADSAVGRRFRGRPNEPWKTVVGVVADFRVDRLGMPTADDDRVFYYALWRQLPAPARTAPVRPPDWIDPGVSYGRLTLLVRMESPAWTSTVLEVARSFDPSLRVSVELVDDIYARQNADTRLARGVVSAFSVLAFGIAIVGVYGLMAFLVTGRRREIGIRMALGAGASDIRRLVLGSSARLVVVGAVIGAALALAATRWIDAQLYGVSALDPATYGGVVAAVLIAALAAAWLPAREASQVDPAVTLRAE
jgi:predicted permease